MNSQTRRLLTKKYLFIAALLPLLLLFKARAFSQQPIFTNQQRFGVEDGLPQSYISGITQDKDGFIWLGTLDGLCRYDGRVFKTFRYRANDSTGLAANTINAFALQKNNSLVLFYDGLMADDFDMQTFKVRRNSTRAKSRTIPDAAWYMHGINSSPPNWLFVTSNYKGVGWLNSATGKISYASKANGLLKQDTVLTLIQSEEGRLYLVSENGVHVSDTARQKFEWIPFNTHVKKWNPEAGPEFFYYYGNSVVILPGNRLGVYAEDKIVILDITKKTSHVYPVPPKSNAGAVKSTGILQADVEGQLYFANYGRVFLLSKEGEMKLLWENTSNVNLRITALFIDRSNVLWLSINAQGLLKIDLQALPFRSYRYKTNFISDIMEQAGVKRSAFPPHWNIVEESYYFRQTYDSKGNLYVCYNYYNKDEIYRLDRQGFRPLPHFPDGAVYTAIAAMPNDEIRVFDQLTSAWYCWKKPESVPEILQLDKDSMKQIELADAKFIGGFLWLSTYSHGLLQYRENTRINQFSGNGVNGLIPKNLTEICVDPVDKNRFWIGSRGGGLILWDVEKGLQKVYTTGDGLPNNTVYCILPDKKGKIWCSTNKGIFRLDAEANEIVAYEKADGLPGNEFNRAHKFLFPDGRMAFGGLEGYTIFDPADFDIKQKAGSVPVLLTGLEINNKPQGINITGSIIKEPLSAVSVINLPYKKNYLRFEFAALMFNRPQKIKYRYRLKGTDADWIENGTNNMASYAALRPGKYTLLINATDSNGLWSTTVKAITIVIHPPFWATWWAYLTYTLIAAGLIRWYFIFREKRIRTEQSLAFERREAFRLKEVDEMKDRFFSNITHEFRTPLTLIITPLEKLGKDPALPADARSTIITAQKNSRQLLKLINEFLDFSKLNDGQMKVKLSSGEMDLFVDSCVQSFEQGALEKNIQLSYTATGISGLYLFDEEKWEKIIVNLLSNALKFAPQNGKISVSVSSEPGDIIKLEITDNGPGIPADQQHKVFERFYQADDSGTRNYGGTGIGLSLVKELTELMQGNVELDSRPGKLTRFIVKIPVQKVQSNENTRVSKNIQAEKQMNSVEKEHAPLLLIVEDNDELRDFLAESMGNHFRVIQAADGLTAWEMILQELPDIVISDVMMPGQDGFDLCKICKTDNRTAHIGFILLTSKAAHDARLKGLGTGADDYITKPFHQDELELRTNNLLQMQQKIRSWLKSQLIFETPQQQQPSISDPFLKQLYQEMDAKLDDPELGVDFLSKAMAMSRSTLNRKLKSLLDISPNDLIRQYRLQKATCLLLSGSDISSAAYQVGFSSPSYFSQCFKEQYGITPSEYISKQG